MAATTDAAGAEPTRSVEVERKWDVDRGATVPDWSQLPGAASVTGPEVRELDARYIDTPDLALAGAGIALRRRTGGPDAGWHIKFTRPDGRHEWAWPLGEEIPDDAVEVDVPPAVRAALRDHAAGPFEVLARLRNRRLAYRVCDAHGGLIAEFVDDDVRALDARAGIERAWREWELELGPAALADDAARAELFAAADALAFAAGAREAASGSKIARTLGR